MRGSSFILEAFLDAFAMPRRLKMKYEDAKRQTVAAAPPWLPNR
jgi:hypothetical protein